MGHPSLSHLFSAAHNLSKSIHKPVAFSHQGKQSLQGHKLQQPIGGHLAGADYRNRGLLVDLSAKQVSTRSLFRMAESR
jgi:hypothetical protein